MKNKLLEKESKPQVEEVKIGEYEFKIKKGLSGLELYHIEGRVSELVKEPLVVEYNKTLHVIPDEIKFVIGMMCYLVVEPEMTPAEWGFVFMDKPGVFLKLAKAISTVYFSDTNSFSAFFSDGSSTSL